MAKDGKEDLKPSHARRDDDQGPNHELRRASYLKGFETSRER